MVVSYTVGSWFISVESPLKDSTISVKKMFSQRIMAPSHNKKLTALSLCQMHTGQNHDWIGAELHIDALLLYHQVEANLYPNLSPSSFQSNPSSSQAKLASLQLPLAITFFLSIYLLFFHLPFFVLLCSISTIHLFLFSFEFLW